jgi:hypothetical protein
MRYAVGWSGDDKVLINGGALLGAVKRVSVGKIRRIEIVLVSEIRDDRWRGCCAIVSRAIVSRAIVSRAVARMTIL